MNIEKEYEHWSITIPVVRRDEYIFSVLSTHGQYGTMENCLSYWSLSTE